MKSRFLLEVIVTTAEEAAEAEAGGADRLEVIRDLPRGGLTPPFGVVEEILARVRIPARVMVRENEGFRYSGREEMETLLESARRLGRMAVDGLVLGFVADGRVDLETTGSLLEAAGGMAATFHRAIEAVADPVGEVERLKGLRSVDRILMSGLPGEWPERVERLEACRQAASPQITILAGGGMTLEHLRALRRSTGLTEFHVGSAAREPAAPDGLLRRERVREAAEALRGA